MLFIRRSSGPEEPVYSQYVLCEVAPLSAKDDFHIRNAVFNRENLVSLTVYQPQMPPTEWGSFRKEILEEARGGIFTPRPDSDFLADGCTKV